MAELSNCNRGLIIAKPKIFTLWPFTEKSANPWSTETHTHAPGHGNMDTQNCIVCNGKQWKATWKMFAAFYNGALRTRGNGRTKLSIAIWMNLKNMLFSKKGNKRVCVVWTHLYKASNDTQNKTRHSLQRIYGYESRKPHMGKKRTKSHVCYGLSPHPSPSLMRGCPWPSHSS